MPRAALSARRGLGLVGALALASSLVVTGCTGGSSGGGSSTTTSGSTSGGTTASSTSSSPSTSSTTTTTGAPTTSATSAPYPSDVPAAARAHTKDGAIAFAQYFVKLSDDSYLRATTAELEAVSLPECKTCSGFITDIQSMKAEGQHQSGPALIARGALEVSPTSTADRREIDVLVEYQAANFVSSSGKVVSTTQTGKATWRVFCWWTGGAWRVHRMAKLVS